MLLKEATVEIWIHLLMRLFTAEVNLADKHIFTKTHAFGWEVAHPPRKVVRNYEASTGYLACEYAMDLQMNMTSYLEIGWKGCLRKGHCLLKCPLLVSICPEGNAGTHSLSDCKQDICICLWILSSCHLQCP